MSHIDVLRRGAEETDEFAMGTLFRVSPGKVSLAIGAPGEDLLRKTAALLADAATESASRPQGHNFCQYGPVRGDAGTLRLLAEFLSRRYNGSPVNPDSIALSAGASAGFFFLCSYFGSRSSTKTVFLEDPCYFLARSVVSDCSLSCVSVTSDEDGMSINSLRDAVQKAGLVSDPAAAAASTDYSALVYTIPDYCNPTGRVMSVERREALVQLAQEYNLLVVCDDIYTLLGLEDAHPLPPRVLTYDASAKGHIVSNGSCSKILAPGLRLGWIEASGSRVMKAIDYSGIGGSGGAANQYASGLLNSLLRRDKLGAHVDFLRSQFAERKRAMCAAMRSSWPSSVEFTEPCGGFFVWVRLPNGRSAQEFFELCQKDANVGFVPGNWTSAAQRCPDYFRLTFAHHPVERLVECVHAMATVLHAFVLNN